MLKFGIVSDFKSGFGKVKFDADGIVSAWLPILEKRTLSDKSFDALDIGEHVVCLMDKNLEDGVILGAIYNSQDIPPADASANSWVRLFKDGTVLKYDREQHSYSILIDTCQFQVSNDGFIIKKGSESLKKIISDLIDGITSAIVITPAGNGSIPVANNPQFVSLKSRLDNLFQ